VLNNGTVAEDACDPTPRHGFTTQCAAPEKKGCGSSSSIAGRRVMRDPNTLVYGGAVLVGLALAALRRRLRR
jgi:hypothetical protein